HVTDNPPSAIRETVPFVVEADPSNKSVNIVIADAEGHGTSTSGVAVGTSFFGSQATGVAPGARLALARTDFFSGSIIEAAIRLVKVDHADVLSLSLGSPNGYTHDTLSATMSAITYVWGVPAFASAADDLL